MNELLGVVEQQEPLSTLESSSGAVAAEPQSARMLILLQNGEQRLITFTLPKESCTVQELLEQVSHRHTSMHDVESKYQSRKQELAMVTQQPIGRRNL